MRPRPRSERRRGRGSRVSRQTGQCLNLTGGQDWAEAEALEGFQPYSYPPGSPYIGK